VLLRIGHEVVLREQGVGLDLVREDRIEEAAADAAERWGEWVAGVNVAYDAAEFSANGVVGDPREGDAERGEDVLNRAGAALAELLGAL